MEKDFEVLRDGTTLTVVLGKELSMANAAMLTDELSKYDGQGIERVVFDATALLFITSSGLRVVFFAYQNLGSQPEIVFENCADSIAEVLDHVGLASFVKFEESPEKRKQYRKQLFANLTKEEIDQIVSDRKETLEQFSVSNDVVCYSMKLGQTE